MGCDPTPLPTRTATPAAAGSSGAERAAPTLAPQDSDAVRAGRALFDAACGSCHSGESPRGGALTNAGKTAAEILSVLHAGSEDGGIMPAVDPRTLREEDLPALRAYLRSIGAER
jgi:mono/diheme cytochrome c family protein